MATTQQHVHYTHPHHKWLFHCFHSPLSPFRLQSTVALSRHSICLPKTDSLFSPVLFTSRNTSIQLIPQTHLHIIRHIQWTVESTDILHTGQHQATVAPNNNSPPIDTHSNGCFSLLFIHFTTCYNFRIINSINSMN